MRITRRVKRILANYESDCPGTKANPARILMHGKLGGSGSIIGRNTFQRPRAEALEMLDTIVKIHQGKA